MSNSPRSPNAQDNNFNLIRLVLAVLVIFSHAFGSLGRPDPLHRLFHTISLAELAVDCFFILSGFLIAMSWENSHSPARFLCNRVLRIYPGFLLAFLVTVLIVGPIGAAGAQVYLHNLRAVSLFQDAISLRSPITPVSFPNTPDTLINRAMWTIHIEFICYLLLLALGVSKLLQRRWPVVLIYAVTLSVFIVFRHLRENAGMSDAIYGGMAVSLLRFIPMFLAGIVMYKTGWHHVRPRWLVAGAAVMLALGLCDRFTAEPALATAGAYLMMVAGTTRILPKSIRQFPDLSYGIYLYGSPGLKLASLIPALVLPEERFAMALTFAAAMALVSWYAVESPALKLKNAKRILNFGRLAAAK